MTTLPSTKQRPIRRFFFRMGQVSKRVAHAAATRARAAWQAIDPDLKRHAYELPILGLGQVAALRPTPPIEARPADGHRPVLLVHGLGGQPGNFIALRAALRALGHRRVYAVDFRGLPTLEACSERLIETMQKLIDVNGLSGEDTHAIDIIAHSMGGLVTRLALEDDAFRRRTALILTLATPHAGSHLAYFANTPKTLALRPDSELIQALGAWDPHRTDTPRLVAFWSDADRVVVPGHAARLEGAENIELKTLTHYGFLFHPKAVRAVMDQLHRKTS